MSDFFDTLPSVSFAPLDPAENEKNILGRYERITGTTLYPGDPVRLFLESVAMDITILCHLVDTAGKQNLLAYASGAHLDHLGALMATARLPRGSARCPLRFELAEPLPFAVLIPRGTRAGTQDRRLTFATDAATLEAVRAALSAEDVRPLTDTVTVAAPELVPYRVKGGWYVRKTESSLAGNISAAVAAAVEQYRLWQRSAPGRDINPTKLIALAERAGAKRVELEEPVFTTLKGWQLARESDVSLCFLGVEDD